MKRNAATLTIGAVLLIIFATLLFTFQVRQTEVAVVTTFDKPTSFHDKPGLKFKWPRPIQKYYLFDKRIQSFEDTFETALTEDGYNLLISVYAGWTISNPTNFFSRFPSGKVSDAQPRLEDLIRNLKLGVVGRHSFSHFVSTDEKQLKFAEIEKEILEAVQKAAQDIYGITIHFLGIKKLGLPESVTAKVFERMSAERQRQIDALRAQGDAEASKIRSQADRERAIILASADTEARQILGQADAEAAQAYEVFQKNPNLALFLQRIRALGEILPGRSTLNRNPRTPPFDLLIEQPAKLAAPPKN